MRLRRSVSTASATPGYWTLTATSSPSRVTARWTWPIEAAAKASSSNSAKTAAGRSPSSSRSSFSTCGRAAAGRRRAAAASVCLNFSRSSSGSAVKSMVESTWPTFMAAPRSWPSCSTSSQRERGGAFAGGRVGALGGADEVRRARAGPARRLAGDEPAEAGGAGEPRGRRAARVPGAWPPGYEACARNVGVVWTYRIRAAPSDPLAVQRRRLKRSQVWSGGNRRRSRRR